MPGPCFPVLFVRSGASEAERSFALIFPCRLPTAWPLPRAWLAGIVEKAPEHPPAALKTLCGVLCFPARGIGASRGRRDDRPDRRSGVGVLPWLPPSRLFLGHQERLGKGWTGRDRHGRHRMLCHVHAALGLQCGQDATEPWGPVWVSLTPWEKIRLWLPCVGIPAFFRLRFPPSSIPVSMHRPSSRLSWIIAPRPHDGVSVPPCGDRDDVHGPDGRSHGGREYLPGHGFDVKTSDPFDLEVPETALLETLRAGQPQVLTFKRACALGGTEILPLTLPDIVDILEKHLSKKIVGANGVWVLQNEMERVNQDSW